MLVAALLVFAAPAIADAAPSAADVFGMSVNRVFNDDFEPAHWDRPLTEVRDAGIGAARSDAFWGWAEAFRPSVPGVHRYFWWLPDEEALALAQHDLRWLPVLGYTPRWASATGDVHEPPENPDDFASYAGGFAARYGRGGSFWAEHPELAPLPVTTYEIWNEPNVGAFWSGKQDAGRFATLYIKARAAIHAVDPQATVVTGGIVPDPWYLKAMYTARPALRGNVDAVGVHPYGSAADGVISNVITMRRALDAADGPEVPIHITEIGWPTRGSGWIPPTSDEDRAKALGTVADVLTRSDCNIASFVPYTWNTPETDPDDVQDWMGIRHLDGRETLTSLAYENVIARWDSIPLTADSRLRICHPPPGGGGPGGGGGGDGTPNRDYTDDDRDGLTDRQERALGTSSYDIDSDDDGLPDGAERRTNPVRPDTDGDGLPDGLEAGITRRVPDPPGPVNGTAPRGPFRADRDPRTRTRGLRRDSDGDGLADRREDRNRNGRRDRGETDPRKRDTDRDGIRDGRDRRPLRRG